MPPEILPPALANHFVDVFALYMLCLFGGMARVHYIGTCIRVGRGVSFTDWILKRA